MLKQKVKEDIIVAMKARDSIRLNTLRGLMANFTNELIAMRRMPHEDLIETDALSVLRREIKKRKEASHAFTLGARKEQADKEDLERAILEAYLPQQMSKDDIKVVAEARKIEFSMHDKKDAGKLMGMVIKDLKDKADSGDVKSVVDALF
jgi:uncharacterized protein YqeY